MKQILETAARNINTFLYCICYQVISQSLLDYKILDTACFMMQAQREEKQLKHAVS